MRILIVEDDHFQAQWIRTHLEKQMPDAVVQLIKTESAFRSQFEAITQAPPSVIVMDVMLRWADPQPPEKMDLPPESIKANGFYRAGLRCAELLQTREETKDVPVILYTVLEQGDLNNDMKGLPQTVSYVEKGKDLTPLIDLIREKGRSH